MERRNLAACDQCHRLKLKCVPLLHECRRCSRLGLQCKTDRERRKRGRKPTAKDSPGSDQSRSSLGGIEYPVLQCLIDSGVCEARQPVDRKTESLPPLCSIWAASRMLDHLYASPNQEFYSGIIRKSRLLDTQNPRPTSPALLCSMLCMSRENFHHVND
ncbi:hypothetical protein L207DRAFT_258347 [Hyaloscypha variabilis F]|uniref:Zn(2)-C6 fungal-type domain-containing protein n=1 Tax=Hyaloscypha variabilis (strain UAMH 11265 / GT02V1 / F) TaxID=1149755 RepID=A0A2J6S4F5_HYAVF|nr:hypothetical protein L207DRAFT_258347 [Hyaloscypha variabilis F]